jgi:hypothetical protein
MIKLDDIEAKARAARYPNGGDVSMPIRFAYDLDPETVLKLVRIVRASKAVLDGLQMEHYWRNKQTLELDEALKGVE